MSAQDEQNLDLFGTLHYVMGGIAALFACIPIIYLIIGITIFTVEFNGGDPSSRVVGLVFIILSAIIILAGWVFAILIIIAGRNLKQRRSYNYCLVIAFLECLVMPIGTVLGVFTIINLTKEPVKELFS